MALATYGDLRQALLRLLGAEQMPEAIVSADDWLAMGELDVWQRLRAPWMVRASRHVTDADGGVDLPPTYLGMLGVVPYDGGEPLQALTAEQAGRYWAEAAKAADTGVNTSSAGEWHGWPVHGPRWRGSEGAFYVIEGGRITFLPLPPTNTRYRLTYWSKIEPAPGDTSGNALIRRAAQVWLYASARHGALAMADDDALRRYDAAFNAGVAEINDKALEWASGPGYVSRMG